MASPAQPNLPHLTGRVLWLCPSHEVRTLYSEAIRFLSDGFNSPLFTPHITFGRLAPETGPQHIGNALNCFKKSRKTLSFPAGDLSCGTPPWQAFRQNLPPVDAVKILSNCFAEELPAGFTPGSDFHVSLFYGDIECRKIRTRFADFPGQLPNTVPCSHITIINLNGPPGQWKAEWQAPL